VDTKPTPGEITIMAAGVVALIFSFFDFWGSPSVTVAGQEIGGGGTSVWGKGLFPIATLMVLFVVIMAAHIALTKFANVQLPERVAGFSWVQVHLILGFFATLYAVAFLLVKSGLDRKVGFWFILAACIAALVGAILLSKERAGGSSTPPAA
jgi:hypothetical protein